MRLLPQMFSVEAQIRIRMKDFGNRKPVSGYRLEPVPGHRMLLTTTTESPQPTPSHFQPKTFQTGDIPGHRVIVEVALYNAPQPSPEFRH
jgi:hypothetical protein